MARNQHEYGYVNDRGEFKITHIRPDVRPADEYQTVGYSDRWYDRADWLAEGQEVARQVRQEIERYDSV